MRINRIRNQTFAILPESSLRQFLDYRKGCCRPYKQDSRMQFMPLICRSCILPGIIVYMRCAHLSVFVGTLIIKRSKFAPEA